MDAEAVLEVISVKKLTAAMMANRNIQNGTFLSDTNCRPIHSASPVCSNPPAMANPPPKRSSTPPGSVSADFQSNNLPPFERLADSTKSDNAPPTAITGSSIPGIQVSRQ